tara:strand:- start:219 stop:1103 length:885 start_codon:yes stop_codon:yes gene_type:complete
LIIGGTGFIGFHLAKRAIKKGWKVTSISTRPPRKIRKLSKVNYLISDITKKKNLKKKIDKYFKYVVNLGGYVDHSDKIKTYKSHYIGCKNLTEILLGNPPEAFIQMGSGGEYGKVKSPQKETFKCYPASVYYKAKLLSSKHLMNIFKKNEFPATVLRLYQVYGPRQDINRFIPIVVDSCVKNKKFPCSEGKQFRDFIYIDDVIDAVIKSLLNRGARGNIINIGSGKPRNIRKLIEYIKLLTKGGYPQFGKIKLRKDEIIKVYPSIEKAKKKIRWKPKTKFEKGINKTIKFYEKK